MKRVFLIGDSIRIGYDAYVRELLEGRAQVYWSGDNARFVQYTLRYISEWAVQDCDPERIDIAYWNNGLWDAAPDAAGRIQTEPQADHRAASSGIPRRDDHLRHHDFGYRGAHDFPILSAQRGDRAL